MKSGHHALQSFGVFTGILVVAPPPGHPLVLLGVVLGLGVGIDADHFLLARLTTGSWSNLERVFRRPSMVVLDQESIFGPDEVGAADRLVSHSVIIGAGVGGLWLLGVRYWAGVTAATLLVHLLADGYSTARKRRPRRPP